MLTQSTDESSLIEVNKGIYSLDGKLDFDVPGKLVIAMHPYFLYSIELPGKYFNIVDSIFANYRGPVLTFDEDANKPGRGIVVESTARHISNLDPSGARYFIKTALYDPHPSEFPNFSPVISFISKFNKNCALIGGAKESLEQPDGKGCLGYFKHLLEQNDIQADYIPGCTF